MMSSARLFHDCYPILCIICMLLAKTELPSTIRLSCTNESRTGLPAKKTIEPILNTKQFSGRVRKATSKDKLGK